jgi:hypothetical protein
MQWDKAFGWPSGWLEFIASEQLFLKLAFERVADSCASLLKSNSGWWNALGMTASRPTPLRTCAERCCTTIA